jgi:uncharacterized protein (TIGR02118 family)
VTRFVVTYRMPASAAAAARFEADYRSSHLPLVARTPGLTRVEISRVTRTVAGSPAPMLVAVLTFEDAAAMRDGMRSEQWAASGRNLAEIGGLELATMFTLDEPEVLDLGR